MIELLAMHCICYHFVGEDFCGHNVTHKICKNFQT